MLWEFIKNKMILNKNKTINDQTNSYTYIEIINIVDNISDSLDKNSYGILCKSELNSAIAILACLSANITTIPLSFHYGELQYNRIIEKIGIHYLLTDDNGQISVKETNSDGYIKPESNPAFILCTSGTTGTPKGAMLSEVNILNVLNEMNEISCINHDDKLIITRPIYHCGVLIAEFLFSLIKGLDIYFYEGSFYPAAICSFINKKKITFIGGTPTLFQHISYFLINRKIDLPIKFIKVSGECITEEIANNIRQAFPNAKVYNAYGLTEASTRVSRLPAEEFDNYCTSVGYPVDFVSVKIIDDKGNELPSGDYGELLVSGPNIMTGYYNDKIKTIEKLKTGWLYTGDIACTDNDGRIYIKCRKDDMIIKSGINIYPQEIENVIKQDKRIQDVIAFGEPNDIWGQRICLRVVAKDITQSEIFCLCKSKLPAFEIPDIIEIVDTIPQNASGKKVRKLTNSI